MSSDDAAHAAAEEVNLSVRMSDLEQKYVDLQQDRKVWFDKSTAGDELRLSLQEEKEAFQSAILQLKSDLSLVTAELQKEKGSKAEIDASATSLQERASRVEAEGDNLRKEIRYVRCKRETSRYPMPVSLIHQPFYLF